MCNSEQHYDLSDVSNYLQDNFKITIQPKQNFRFRYIKDLQKSSHGFLKGQQPSPTTNKASETDDLYPTVKLLLPTNGHLDEHNNGRVFFVMCTLHNSNVKCLSPHVLLGKGEKSVHHKFIFHKMQESDVNPAERFWELQKYGIVCVKDFKGAFDCKCKEYRKLKLPMNFERIKGKLNLNEKRSIKMSGELNVCLGFTIFERDCIDHTFRLYKETIFSDTIYNGNELKIHRLCNLNGSIEGGKKINILIKLEPNLPLTILIKRKTKEIEWSTNIKIEKNDIFGNHAITFELPPYDGPSCTDDEILVDIEVVVTGSTYKSKSAKFNYLNYTDDDRPRKKARYSSIAIQEVTSYELSLDAEMPAINPHDMHYVANDVEMSPSPSGNLQQNLNDLSLENSFTTNNNLGPESNQDLLTQPCNVSRANGSVVSRDKILPLNHKHIEIHQKRQIPKSEPLEIKIKNKIENIFKMPKDVNDIDIMGLTNKDDNTIFHEALTITDYFFHFYKMASKSPHRDLVRKARNQYRENLIHYSSVYNRARCIRPLIGMGCRLYEQDTEGRTPLHTAMELNHNDCILQIQQLLKDHSEYPQEVEENLIKMFKVYNHKGFTVLHAAVVDNRLELVQIMLEFCRKFNINVKDYEVLGNGDSLLHLIVEHNLIDMAKCLPRFVSNYLSVENYTGLTALDIPDISKEMQQTLNAQ